MSHIRESQLTDYLVENQARFYRLAYSYLHNREDALDAVQAAVCKALEKQDSLRDADAVRTWFYRILVNVCTDLLRGRKREAPIAPEDLDPGSYEDPLPDDTLARRVEALPPEFRAVIQLRFYEELPLKEIGAVLNCPLSTVKTRLYTGLKKITRFTGRRRSCMNEFKEAKQAYENTPIPAELDQRVRAGIRQGKAKRARQAWGKRLGTVAACFVVVVGALNVSPTMASAAADIPVLGGLFRVLTIRSYETEKDQVHYQVEVPEVDSSADIAQRVNVEIQQRVDEHVAEMEKMWTEYHEAFIATGGTEEEWAQRSMDVNVTYDIKSQTDTTVSFVVDLSQCSFNASQTQYYYNLDLENDKDITLRDLLGDDWVNICNTAIQAQIDASVDADGFTYFFSPEEGGFTTVDESTSFYIREDGVPVVVFPEYAIAAGAMGIVEFEISQ